MQPALSVLRAEGLFDQLQDVNEPTSHFYFVYAGRMQTLRGINLQARYGEPYMTVRRGDLQNALLRGLSGDAPIYGSDVVGVQPVDPDVSDGLRLHVKFADGSLSDDVFDAVVGADGIDSKLRAHVLHGASCPQKESAVVNVIGVAPLKPLPPTLVQALKDRNGFAVYLDPAITLILSKVTPTKVMWGVVLTRSFSHARQAAHRGRRACRSCWLNMSCGAILLLPLS